MTIKLKSGLIVILSAGFLLLAGTYFYAPSIIADHGKTAEACLEDQNVAASDKQRCIEHAEKDQEFDACWTRESDSLTGYIACLEGIEPAGDGYDGGAEEKLSEIEAIRNAPSPEDDEACLSGAEDCFVSTPTNFDNSNNPIYERLNGIINFLSVGAGILITISVVVSGIQWAVSGGNPQGRAAAGKRLWNSGVAILLYVFGWALLNWLVPGGMLG